MVIPDTYSLLLQSDIITTIQGCTHLAVLDAASFFYQWKLHPDFQYMFIVVTYRGQETFQVLIIDYINSVAYVQWEIDNILRSVRDWARVYVNDIICGARSLDDLLSKLCILFEIFVTYNISIKPTKTFFNYPNIGLLGQEVNILGLTIAKEKLNAIRLLQYPLTMGVLEYYLGLTGYLCSYIYYYPQLAEPLQTLKTTMLKSTPLSGQQQRAYALKIKLLPPSPAELAAFQSLQETLSKPTTLIHHDPDKILWIDLDAFKEFGFGAVVFHTFPNEELPEEKWPSRSSLQLILFLSRLLTLAERNYWPTELEIAGFVWVIGKVRHVVESSRAKVIIQTDYIAILDILNQSSITSTTLTIQMNICLVRASQFLQQFRLVVQHKPRKEHILPDALSRLASANTNLPSQNPTYSKLDALFVYNAMLVAMNEDLAQCIVEGYKSNP